MKTTSGILALKTLALFICLTVALTGCPGKKKREHQERQFRAIKALGMNCIKLKNYDCAIRELAKAAEIMPRDAGTQLGLGVAYYSQGNMIKAEAQMHKALKLRSSFPQARNYLGLVYMEQKHWDEAIIQFDKAYTDGTGAHPWMYLTNKGISLYEKGKPLDAIPVFTQALNDNPRYCLANYHMGVAYSQLDNSSAAITNYRKTLKWCPDLQLVHFDLGKEYNKIKDRWRACGEFNTAFNLDPDTENGTKALRYATMLRCPVD